MIIVIKTQTMINTYLLQRANIKTENKGNSKGIDTILSFDYMGSAEFEFGALPKSLKRLRESKAVFKYTNYDIGHLQITLFAGIEISQHFEEWLWKLKKRKIRLKEWSRFNYYFSDNTGFLPNFWWSLDNDFMFWIKNDDFEKQFKELI